MVVTDLLLTATGDLAFNSDLAIVEGLDLAYQNMLRFIRSDPEDLLIGTSMSFGIGDYAGLPNTRTSADIIRDDFLDKVSSLEAFEHYDIDVEVYPTDVKELKMEISMREPEGGGELVLAGNVLHENGFMQIPNRFETNIYDTSRSESIVEIITLEERTDKIRTKYRPEISSFVMFNGIFSRNSRYAAARCMVLVHLEGFRPLSTTE